jgi:uncharacterized protein
MRTGGHRVSLKSAFRSAIYVGSVMHRRLQPRVHHFRYRAFWLLLDLDEMPRLSHGLRTFSHNRPNLFSLYDKDHGDGSATPLRAQMEQQLAQAGIENGVGRILLLCMPRTLGFSFNPISIYFCHSCDGSLAALIYQVHNTFGGRHSYVIPVAADVTTVRQTYGKDFFVSPFMAMDLRYEFRLSAPAERLAVAIRASGSEGPVLNAALVGRRQTLTDGALLRIGVALPAITLKVILAIHWEAVRLLLKGVRYRGRAAETAPSKSLSSMHSVKPG